MSFDMYIYVVVQMVAPARQPSGPALSANARRTPPVHPRQTPRQQLSLTLYALRCCTPCRPRNTMVSKASRKRHDSRSGGSGPAKTAMAGRTR